MLTRIAFENFRGFKERTEIDDMKRITLISGRNNSGKTSVLEGVLLYIAHSIPDIFNRLGAYRGILVPAQNGIALNAVNKMMWEHLFYGLTQLKPIHISATFDGETGMLEYAKDDRFIPPVDNSLPQDMINIITSKSAYYLKYSFSKGNVRDEGHFISADNGIVVHTGSSNTKVFDAVFINSYLTATANGDAVDWFGNVVLHGDKDKLIKAMQVIEPSITDMQVIPQNGLIQLYAQIHSFMMPLKLAGDGLNAIAFIIMAILANPGAVILIDEIENGFHYTAYPKLWEAVANAAQAADCQVIATTHSYECISGAVDGIKEAGAQDEFAFYRLDRDDDDHVRVVRYDNELIDSAIDFSVEVR